MGHPCQPVPDGSPRPVVKRKHPATVGRHSRGGWNALAHSACIVVALGTLSACGGGGTVSSPGIGDQCLVGSWTQTGFQGAFDGLVSGVTMSVKGGVGVTLTYTAGGAETDDYSSSAPFTASGGGHTAQFTLRGVDHFTIQAKDNRWTQLGPDQSLAISIVIDGGPQVHDTDTFPGGHGTYTCSGSDLTVVAESPVATTQTLKRL